MRLASILAFGLLLAGCERAVQRKPAVSDADFAEFKAAYPGMKERCLDEVRYRGFVAFHPDDPDCFDMLPSQRWKGLLNGGPESVSFGPEPAKECPLDADHGDISLDFSEGAYRDPEGFDSDILEGIYRIDFIGRRTKVPASFGHQAQYDHFIVVDRVISFSKVPGRMDE